MILPGITIYYGNGYTKINGESMRSIVILDLMLYSIAL